MAIDAEFVSLDAEDVAVRADGTRIILNPTHFSLARVTVCYGEGPLSCTSGFLLHFHRLQLSFASPALSQAGPRAGEAFIDDYIATRELVADYLTRFSGINPGDLDVCSL